MSIIPEPNLKMPILARIGPSQGSGWFLTVNGFVNFVTCKHVLFNDADPAKALYDSKLILEAYAWDIPGFAGKNVWEIDVLDALKKKQLFFHPSKDIAVLCVAKIVDGTNFNPAANLKIIQSAGKGPIFAELGAVKSFSDVTIGNEAFVYGYPTSVGVDSQLERDKPLLGKGIISGKNDLTKRIILSVPVYPGNSGGPVVEISHVGGLPGQLLVKHSIIGTICQYVPWTYNGQNSGYSIAEPIESITEVISGTAK